MAEQKKLIARREFIFASAQRTYGAFENIKPEQVELNRPRFDELSVLKSNFQDIQMSIADLNTQVVVPAKPIEIDKVQDSFETVFYAAKSRFLTAVNLNQRPAVTHPGSLPASVMPSIALPVIDLPKFKGDICKWPEFYSHFKSLIDDNKSLSNVQKLHYLKTSLSEIPLALISEFQLTEENYPLALQTLVSRYQNKRLLGSLYVHKILDFVPLKTSSYDGLQAFLKVHRNSVDSLKALNIPDLGDFLLLCLALANLDASSRKAFETKQSSSSTPEYNSLINFVDDQSKVMELCAVGKTSVTSVKSSPPLKKVNTLLVSSDGSSSSSKRSQNDSSRNHTHTNVYTCPLCKASHSLYQCNAFRGLTIDQRYDTLRQLKRCFNCMGAHLRTQCSSTKSCSVCHSTKHHSMLHVDSIQSVADETPVSDQGHQVPQTLSCHVRVSNPTHQTVLSK